jgi:DNA modification methylase
MSQPAPLKVKQIPVEELHNAPWNANRVPEDVLAKVRRSIADFGVVENLVARERPDGGYEVISGNHRLGIYREMGVTKAPVHVVDVDDAHARILAQTLNRTRGQDDAEAYAALLTDVLAEMDMDEVLAYLPESERTITQALDAVNASADDSVDDVPDLPDEPDSKPGEVYDLGPHRLVCGDATEVGTFDELLGGDKVNLVFTDPPYGIAYKAMRGGRDIHNDATDDQAAEVMRDAFALVSSPAWFVCCDWRSHRTALDALAYVGVEPKATIVWDKGRRVQNLDRFAKQHEFIVYAGPYGGEKTADVDVWTVERDFNPDHPTPKPVALIERAITPTTKRDGIVLDPFGGSGSTLIAADRLGRRARLVELDPRYCDVIRKRWEKHNG